MQGHTATKEWSQSAPVTWPPKRSLSTFKCSESPSLIILGAFWVLLFNTQIRFPVIQESFGELQWAGWELMGGARKRLVLKWKFLWLFVPQGPFKKH